MNIARIQSKHSLNATTSTFIFKVEGESQGVKTFYQDLSMVGKHFLVTAIGTHVSAKRQYTICNCMKPQVYNAYV